VDGGDHFHNHRHAHRIRPDSPEEAGLGGSFQARAEQPDIDSPMERELLGERGPHRQVLQLPAIGFGHVRKAWPPRIQVGAAQGVVAGEVDVVGDQHQLPGAELGVEPAGRGGNDQPAHSERLHHPDREGDLLCRIAFKKMEPPLHRDHRLPVPPPAEQTAFMAG